MPRSEIVAAAYRLHALRCAQKLPKELQTSTTDLYFLKMAAALLALAEQAKKNSRVYKTPESLQRQQQPGTDVSKTQD
jgi:hypothetical protein